MLRGKRDKGRRGLRGGGVKAGGRRPWGSPRGCKLRSWGLEGAWCRGKVAAGGDGDTGRDRERDTGRDWSGQESGHGWGHGWGHRGCALASSSGACPHRRAPPRLGAHLEPRNASERARDTAEAGHGPHPAVTSGFWGRRGSSRPRLGSPRLGLAPTAPGEPPRPAPGQPAGGTPIQGVLGSKIPISPPRAAAGVWQRVPTRVARR